MRPTKTTRAHWRKRDALGRVVKRNNGARRKADRDFARKMDIAEGLCTFVAWAIGRESL